MCVLGHMVAGGAHGAHAVSVHLLPPLPSSLSLVMSLGLAGWLQCWAVRVWGLVGLRCPGTAGWFELGLVLLEVEGDGFWRTHLIAELLPDIFSSQIL